MCRYLIIQALFTGRDPFLFRLGWLSFYGFKMCSTKWKFESRQYKISHVLSYQLNTLLARSRFVWFLAKHVLANDSIARCWIRNRDRRCPRIVYRKLWSLTLNRVSQSSAWFHLNIISYRLFHLHEIQNESHHDSLSIEYDKHNFDFWSILTSFFSSFCSRSHKLLVMKTFNSCFTLSLFLSHIQ